MSIFETFRKDLKNYEESTISLKRLTMVKVVVFIWQNDSVREKIASFLQNNNYDFMKYVKWIEVENDIFNATNQIVIPDGVLKRELVDEIIPIGSQISNWLKYHSHSFQIGNDNLLDCVSKLSWTNEGSIDYKNTFKLFMTNQELKSNGKLFNLACNYCLEKEIRELWYEIPEILRINYCNGSMNGTFEYHLIIFWVCYIRNDLTGLIEKFIQFDYLGLYNVDESIEENMFRYSVRVKNIFAAEYFLKKLTDQEKSKNISMCCLQAVSLGDPDMFYFLLKEMDEGNMHEMFEKNSFCLLKGFVLSERPWQEFLVDTAILSFKFIEKKDYNNLKRILFRDIPKHCRVGDKYMKTVLKIYENSPMKKRPEKK